MHIEKPAFIVVFSVSFFTFLYFFYSVHTSSASVSFNNAIKYIPEPKDAKFQKAMETVFKHEGGLTDNRNDPGSWTKYGISLRFIKHAHIDIDNDGDEDKEDIIHLTKTEADVIYYKDWYINHHYDKIKSQIILTDVLDFSINAGASECHKIIKRALNAINAKKIPINSNLDNTTIDLINKSPETRLHTAINNEQIAFYKELVKRNPELKVFLKGWIARANA